MKNNIIKSNTDTTNNSCNNTCSILLPTDDDIVFPLFGKNEQNHGTVEYIKHLCDEHRCNHG